MHDNYRSADCGGGACDCLQLSFDPSKPPVAAWANVSHNWPAALISLRQCEQVAVAAARQFGGKKLNMFSYASNTSITSGDSACVACAGGSSIWIQFCPQFRANLTFSVPQIQFCPQKKEGLRCGKAPRRILWQRKQLQVARSFPPYQTLELEHAVIL